MKQENKKLIQNLKTKNLNLIKKLPEQSDFTMVRITI